MTEYIKNKYFKIINNNDKTKVLDIINNEALIINQAHNGMHQNWYYNTKTNQFINLLNKKVLEIHNDKLIISEQTNNQSQKWEYIDGKIKSLLNNKYITFNESNPNNIYIADNLDKPNEKNKNQQWLLFYIDIDVKILNQIEKKHIEEKINKHEEKTTPNKTLKVPEKHENIKISLHKMPKISTKITIQAWIKINKFKHSETFKPIYYLNNNIGLWLMPHKLNLFTHKDFDINFKIKLNEWINVAQIYNYEMNIMRLYINSKLIFTIKINEYDSKTKKLVNRIEPNIFNIINNDEYKVGSLNISNYELDNVKITEVYKNSIYNENNNIFSHEIQIMKQKYDDLNKKYELLKYSKCPPEKKCISPESNYNKNQYVLKTEAEKKYDLLLKQLNTEAKNCSITNNNIELKMKHQIINIENENKRLKDELANIKKTLALCNSNFI